MIELSTLPDVILTILLVIFLARALGLYLSKVFMGRPSLLDPIMVPFESALMRLMGVDPDHQMKWKEYAVALLSLNAAGLIFAFLLLTFQGGLPLNSLGAPGMSWDLALHTAASFTTNTDFQHYVPEQQVSLLSSMLGLLVLMFLSAATGISVMVAFTRGFSRRDGSIGNFYFDVTQAFTRVLLPLSVLGALLFILAGVPQTLTQSVTIYPWTGGAQTIPLGPVAAWDGIEFLGTNGGGFYAANAANPLQNPSAVTNLISVVLMLLIPFASPFMFSRMVRREQEARPLLATILSIFLLGLFLMIFFQSSNPFLASTGVSQSGGYLVGAEQRFTLPESALFQVTSIYSNTGATSMALGSLTPGAQIDLFWGMFLQCVPGGDGTGFGMLLINVILAIFVGGLMVGRTPEYLGNKIGKHQMKWAAVTILSHPFAILIPTAITFVFGLASFSGGTAAHQFTVVLYEFTSESANNGSGMSSLNDNTLFFNLAGTIVMLVGRYLPIIAMLAIGGSLASTDPAPPGPGTLKTNSATFTIYLILFITIVTGLLFLPVLVMGPFAQGALGGP
ncbi:MAG: potassium-transporting ATPase subunit KdpA [Candidatus Thermoplasmatota archaeon]|jgi:K+-transporting ATPase ATPase A chain|nr:potassium-transporting ATPase subunit KdpA [Candidatus Thermoplasmatota archaeon]MCL5983955.1 potassium-transporting ATPase subunit KdpA [Candidatus Thermoplasmatota archaeon]